MVGILIFLVGYCALRIYFALQTGEISPFGWRLYKRADNPFVFWGGVVILVISPIALAAAVLLDRL